MLPQAAPRLRQRQVHLDFHTSPAVAGIGARFDAEEFGRAFSEAHVDSVTIFARCHHGYCYYPSEIGPMHPGLDFDLLGAQIDALHARGIRAPIYVTVVWDQFLGEKHPDWLQRKPDGRPYGDMPERASWHWLSPAVQAYQDYLADLTAEILARYGDKVDGFFFDILMTGPEGDCNPEAVARREARGLPDTVAGRKASDHATYRELMARLSDLIARARPEATIFYNSRFGLEFRDEAELYTHVEIEALPTGGWGYGYFPLWARYGRNFGLPYLGMTGRFHTHWGDFGALKEPSALHFECGGILANGGACSIGDQLPPDGRPDPAVYALIGEAYARVKALEPWTAGAQAVTEVGLLLHTKADPAQFGAAKMLLEGHVQFDCLDRASDLTPYRVIIVPEGFGAHPDLRDYVAQGGAVILGPGAAEGSLGEFECAETVGPAAITPTYFRTAIGGLREFDYVVYEPALDLRPLAGAEVVAERRDALFTREPHRFLSHMHAPAAESAADSPAVVQKGRVTRLGQPLFTTYQKKGTIAYRKLFLGLLGRLLPDPILRTNAPSSAELTVMRQGERTLVHALNYSPARRGDHVEVWDEPVPLHDVWVSVRAQGDRVTLVPSGESLPCSRAGDRVEFTIPRVETHRAACIDFAPQ